MTNVPSAVWIDEQGCIARPTENAGSSEAWRYSLDRETGELAPEALADASARREIYLDALRDWARRGRESPHVSRDADVHETRASVAADAEAATHFRLATHLIATGQGADAQRWLREAAKLSPRSWRIKRELWTRDDPGNLAAGNFWDEVDALGDELYYEPPTIEGMPPQVTGA